MPDKPTQPLDELLDVHGRDVLDVGCGEGWLSRRLASAGARVVGLDPLASALERARGHESSDPWPRYVEGAAEALDFPDSSFDVVIFFNSLHHVPAGSMDAALAEAARVLRTAGVLYVQEPLAQGPAFELLRPVNDETPVREAAQQALGRALQERFVELVGRDAVLTVRHPDFDALRAHTISVDPARAAAFDEHETALRTAFERLGRPLEGGGMEFDQEFRINLFEANTAWSPERM
jgi:ubiquinone/menaquinone biosynthesis C-methylase UbiE